MKILILLVMCMLKTGCSLISENNELIKNINSMPMGETYHAAIKKIGREPNTIDCHNTVKTKTCAVLYRLSGRKNVVFTFRNDILTDVYKGNSTLEFCYSTNNKA